MLKNVNLLNLILILAIVFFALKYVIPTYEFKSNLNVATEKHEVAINSESLKQSVEMEPEKATDYAVISENNLFHPERKIVEEPKEETQQPPVVVQEEKVEHPFALRGTLIAGDLRVAYLEDLAPETPLSDMNNPNMVNPDISNPVMNPNMNPNMNPPLNPGAMDPGMNKAEEDQGLNERKLNIYHIGETLSGYTLSEILEDSVVLTKEGEEPVRLKVYDPNKQRDTASIEPTIPPNIHNRAPVSPRRMDPNNPTNPFDPRRGFDPAAKRRTNIASPEARRNPANPPGLAPPVSPELRR
jgi:type II secretory pathway component PulC